MSGSERREPFVAWVSEPASSSGALNARETDYFCVPVIVTPLLPDDPKVGERWLLNDTEVEVLSPVYEDTHFDDLECVVRYRNGSTELVSVGSLTRPPVEKTYRLPLNPGRMWREPDGSQLLEVVATSREEALAKLADTLEEVE